MACNNEEIANQWQYYIVQGSIYSTYLEEKLKKELNSNERMSIVESCMRIENQKEIELLDEKYEELKTDSLSTTRTRADTLPTLSDLPQSFFKEEGQTTPEKNCQKNFQDQEVNLDSFEILKDLGSGSFGKVYMVSFSFERLQINFRQEKNQMIQFMLLKP